jgi:TetR/AcrR family transcriptional regulator
VSVSHKISDSGTLEAANGVKTPNPRWERRKDARPAEIIAAALDLFVEKGFAATKLDEVAVRSGVSKGTLYLYFPSKEEMFKAVVRETIVPLLKQFAEGLSRSQLSASAALDLFFQEWWSKFGSTKSSGICKVVIAEAGNFPEMAMFFEHEVITPSHAILGSIIQNGMRSGEFRELEVETCCHLIMAPLVIQAIWQHSIGLCQPKSVSDPEQLIKAHRDNIRRAFAPDPPGLSAEVSIANPLRARFE